VPDVFEISLERDDPRRLTQAVLQITALLDLYQAELARILGLQCPDIGRLSAGQQSLQPGTCAWQQAVLLVRCYRALYKNTGGDGVAMRHWLRVRQVALNGIPHLLLVDEGRLAAVVECLEQAAADA
jgi:hypothetical protein